MRKTIQFEQLNRETPRGALKLLHQKIEIEENNDCIAEKSLRERVKIFKWKTTIAMGKSANISLLNQ